MMDLTFFKTAFHIYPESIQQDGELTCFMIDAGESDRLCVVGHHPSFPGEPLSQSGHAYTLSELNHAAAVFLREHFPFCAPAAVLDRKTTFGAGDRLGLAGPGLLRVFQEYDVFPVLAQQSVRELTLTRRTMDDVIDSASFAVFRAGYRRGFGVDGDHLKTLEEVREALARGCTMITLDCSDFLDNAAGELPDGELAARCAVSEERKARYLGHLFEIGPRTALSFNPADLRRITAVYSGAIDFIRQVYEEYLLPRGTEVDLEISLDETLTVTSPLAHFFVANELKIRGVRFVTLAPRFSGEFQKGIDYIGDPEVLRGEVRVHRKIAEYFGYKLSFHSGSDKFSVFPILSQETQGRFHIKTSGTNWLEAVRVLAEREPALFRAMYGVAEATFEENRRFYHVTPDRNAIPDAASLEDAQLPGLLDQTATRQMLHIGYGKILEDQDLKARLYRALREHRQAYSDALYRHIGRHVQTLGIPRRPGQSNLNASKEVSL